MTLADRVILMNKGRVEQVAPPLDMYERPNGRFSSTFLGKANVFDARCTTAGGLIESGRPPVAGDSGACGRFRLHRASGEVADRFCRIGGRGATREGDGADFSRKSVAISGGQFAGGQFRCCTLTQVSPKRRRARASACSGMAHISSWRTERPRERRDDRISSIPITLRPVSAGLCCWCWRWWHYRW